MSAQILPIEFLGGASYQAIGVRFKRSEGLIYDPSDGTFKAEASITDPYVALTYGTPGTSEATLWTGSISMNPAQWTDGDYRAYYHTTTTLPAYTEVLGEFEFQIVGGSGRAFNPTDIALRLMAIGMASHNQAGSMGALLNRNLVLLEYIATWISRQPGSSPKP